MILTKNRYACFTKVLLAKTNLLRVAHQNFIISSKCFSKFKHCARAEYLNTTSVSANKLHWGFRSVYNYIHYLTISCSDALDGKLSFEVYFAQLDGIKTSCVWNVCIQIASITQFRATSSMRNTFANKWDVFFFLLFEFHRREKENCVRNEIWFCVYYICLVFVNRTMTKISSCCLGKRFDQTSHYQLARKNITCVVSSSRVSLFIV